VRYLLHDRDAIFSAALDDTARSFGLSVLKSPPRGLHHEYSFDRAA
jgi:hypothetical protein